MVASFEAVYLRPYGRALQRETRRTAAQLPKTMRAAAQHWPEVRAMARCKCGIQILNQNRHHQPMSHGPCANQSGASLLEVLMSTLVLALGLLGVAGLFSMSVRSHNASFARQQSVALAHDIIEKMRANRAAALAGDYDLPASANPSGDHRLVRPASDCSATECDGPQVAAYDKWYWLEKEVARLPGGTGTITVRPTGSEFQVSVTIRWNDALLRAVPDTAYGALTTPQTAPAQIVLSSLL
jgi:type IV pilus assembly protein PilV